MRLKLNIVVGAFVVAIPCMTLHASVQSLAIEVENFNGIAVARLYVAATNAQDNVLSVFNFSGLAADFHHADFGADTFSPVWTAQVQTDTFVTIGGVPGFSNTTGADPGWDPLGFLSPSIPVNAGWFNGNPPNGQGSVDPDSLRVLIAQFAFNGPIPQVTLTMSIAWNQGLGTPTQIKEGLSIQIPAPAAVLPIVVALRAPGQRSRRRS